MEATSFDKIKLPGNIQKDFCVSISSPSPSGEDPPPSIAFPPLSVPDIDPVSYAIVSGHAQGEHLPSGNPEAQDDVEFKIQSTSCIEEKETNEEVIEEYFRHWRVEKGEIKVLNEIEALLYAPHSSKSVGFSFRSLADSSIGTQPISVNLFEGSSSFVPSNFVCLVVLIFSSEGRSKDYIIHTGGSSLAMDWVPRVEGCDSQFVAIGCCICGNKKHFYRTASSGSSLIEIWKVSEAGARLVMNIVDDDGDIRALKWFPVSCASSSFETAIESSDNPILGILGVIDESTQLKIKVVSLPSYLDTLAENESDVIASSHGRTRWVKITPRLVCSLNEINNSFPIGMKGKRNQSTVEGGGEMKPKSRKNYGHFRNLSWNPNYYGSIVVAVGTDEGDVILWSIPCVLEANPFCKIEEHDRTQLSVASAATTPSSTYYIRLPLLTFSPHNSVITSLEWSLPYYLTTSSLDGSASIWDIRSPDKPLCTRDCSALTKSNAFFYKPIRGGSESMKEISDWVWLSRAQHYEYSHLVCGLQFKRDEKESEYLHKFALVEDTKKSYDDIKISDYNSENNEMILLSTSGKVILVDLREEYLMKSSFQKLRNLDRIEYCKFEEESLLILDPPDNYPSINFDFRLSRSSSEKGSITGKRKRDSKERGHSETEPLSISEAIKFAESKSLLSSLSCVAWQKPSLYLSSGNFYTPKSFWVAYTLSLGYCRIRRLDERESILRVVPVTRGKKASKKRLGKSSSRMIKPQQFASHIPPAPHQQVEAGWNCEPNKKYLVTPLSVQYQQVQLKHQASFYRSAPPTSSIHLAYPYNIHPPQVVLATNIPTNTPVNNKPNGHIEEEDYRPLVTPKPIHWRISEEKT